MSEDDETRTQQYNEARDYTYAIIRLARDASLDCVIDPDIAYNMSHEEAYKSETASVDRKYGIAVVNVPNHGETETRSMEIVLTQESATVVDLNLESY